jgi:hypothetical protein
MLLLIFFILQIAIRELATRKQANKEVNYVPSSTLMNTTEVVQLAGGWGYNDLAVLNSNPSHLLKGQINHPLHRKTLRWAYWNNCPLGSFNYNSGNRTCGRRSIRIFAQISQPLFPFIYIAVTLSKYSIIKISLFVLYMYRDIWAMAVAFAVALKAPICKQGCWRSDTARDRRLTAAYSSLLSQYLWLIAGLRKQRTSRTVARATVPSIFLAL